MPDGTPRLSNNQIIRDMHTPNEHEAAHRMSEAQPSLVGMGALHALPIMQPLERASMRKSKRYSKRFQTNRQQEQQYQQMASSKDCLPVVMRLVLCFSISAAPH